MENFIQRKAYFYFCERDASVHGKGENAQAHWPKEISSIPLSEYESF